MDRLEIVVVDIQTDDLFRGRRGGPAAQKPAIFCAYRMTSPQSLQMRHDLESRLDAATNVFVLDGRVADGEPWASTIRDRIKRSRLVVADVSGPSREVLFELGFARNKALVTIVETDQHRERLPRWLPSFQMSAYSGGGLTQIVNSIVTRLHSPQQTPRRRPAPIPGQIVWIEGRDSAWASSGRNRVRNAASESGLDIVVVRPDDLVSFEDLTSYLRAWLVFGCVDGGEQDYAVHFFAGDIAARAHAGAGPGRGQSIARGAVLFARDDDIARLCIADSVHRLSRSTRSIVTSERDLLKATAHLLKRYRRWLSLEPPLRQA